MHSVSRSGLALDQWAGNLAYSNSAEAKESGRLDVADDVDQIGQGRSAVVSAREV